MIRVLPKVYISGDKETQLRLHKDTWFRFDGDLYHVKAISLYEEGGYLLKIYRNGFLVHERKIRKL